jgi:hypothetical protein
MMIRFEKVALLSGLLLALGAACGGDSDDGDAGGGGASGAPGGSVDTGLPEDRPLEDVTVTEFSNACDALRDDVSARLGPDEATRGVCEVYSGALTDDPAQCRTAAATCVGQIDDGTFPLIEREDLDFTNFECGDVGGLQGCTVTVGEFETCLEDRISAVEDTLAGNDCSNAASVDLNTVMGLLALGGESPASCTRVDQECPGAVPSFGAL